MRKMMWMLGIATVIVAAACSPKDRNFITGTTDFTGIALANDPPSYSLHVHLVPIAYDTTFESDSVTVASIDTVPAHDVPVDSGVFAPVTTLVPQGTVVANANGSDAERFTFSPEGIAELPGSGYVVPDTTGSTVLTITYTDKNHDNAVTTLDIPITVTQVP